MCVCCLGAFRCVCGGVLCAASVSGTGVGGGLLPVCVLALCVCVWVFMCLCGCHDSQAAVAPAVSPRVSRNTPSGSRMGATASRVVIPPVSTAKQPPRPPSSEPARPRRQFLGFTLTSYCLSLQPL